MVFNDSTDKIAARSNSLSASQVNDVSEVVGRVLIDVAEFAESSGGCRSSILSYQLGNQTQHLLLCFSLQG